MYKLVISRTIVVEMTTPAMSVYNSSLVLSARLNNAVARIIKNKANIAPTTARTLSAVTMSLVDAKYAVPIFSFCPLLSKTISLL